MQKDVSASILYDGSNYMLALKSEFGTSNEMKVTDNHGSSPLYAYDTTNGARMTQRVAGTDSSFTVDGVSMTRSSNSIDDLFNGMTLELLKSSGSPITIKSEVDLASARDAITSFVTTYNDVYASLKALRESDPDTDSDIALLSGDSLLRTIMSIQLASKISI